MLEFAILTAFTFFEAVMSKEFNWDESYKEEVEKGFWDKFVFKGKRQ